MSKILLLLLACSVSSAFAGLRTAGQVKAENKDGQFSATLKEGFHFNEKAPNVVRLGDHSIKPTTLTAREIKFTELPKDASGSVALFICDDAVTFCETSNFDLKTATEVAVAAPAVPATVKKGARKKKVEGEVYGELNKNGFIQDDYNKALNQAKSEKKLLLIDFSARWCPGCVRLESETFPTAPFKKMSENFVKLKIDLDRFENGVLSEKFAIKGIPTLLVLTGDQEEVDRLVDYQPNEIMTPFFAGIAADPASLRELSEKARDKNPEVLLRLGRRLLAAGRSGEAFEAMKGIKPPPPEFLDAQVKTYPKDIKILRAAIASEPKSSRSIPWRGLLCEASPRFEEKMKIRADGTALADELLADPAKLKDAVKTDLVGEYTGFESFMIAMARAELIESCEGANSEVEAAWKKAAQVGTSSNIPSSKVGVALRHLIVLTKAREYQQADRLAARLIKADPKNPELERRRLRLFVELKNFDGAISLGKKVIANSYGRNEFWAAEVVAKAYAQTERKRGGPAEPRRVQCVRHHACAPC